MRPHMDPRRVPSRVVAWTMLCMVSWVQAQYSATSFPVPALSSYEQRYEAVRNLWLQGRINKNFIVGQVEMGGLKLQARPGHQATKDSIYACLRQQAVVRNFGFNLFSGMQGYLLGKASFASAADQEVWRDWLGKADFTKGYIGSNQGRYIHWTAVHLIAQEWPDFRDSAGHGADTLDALARRNLTELLSGTFHDGDHDRGDEIYSSEVSVALKLLATFTRDASLKRQAEAAYFSTLANYATGWNQGLYTAPALREKHFNQSGPFDPLGLYTTAWILFGSPQGLLAPPSWVQFLFPFPSYLDSIVPPALVELGQSRDRPLAIRSSNDLAHPYTWHSPSYSLASMWVGGWERNRSVDYTITEQRLKWKSDKPGAVFVVAHENYQSSVVPTGPRNPYGLGHNPFARVFQHEATQMGVLNVSDTSYHWQAQYALFSRTGSILGRKDTAGWVFADAGATFFAVLFPKGRTWGTDSVTGYDVIRSDHRRNGWILESAEASRYGSSAKPFAAFVADVLANSRPDAKGLDDSLPRLAHKSIHGYSMEMVHDPRPPFVNPETSPKVRRVAGVDQPSFASWPALATSNGMAYQSRRGDTLHLVGKSGKAMVIWNRGLVVPTGSTGAPGSRSTLPRGLEVVASPGWTDCLRIRLPAHSGATRLGLELRSVQGVVLRNETLPPDATSWRMEGLSRWARGTYLLRLMVDGRPVAGRILVKS